MAHDMFVILYNSAPGKEPGSGRNEFCNNPNLYPELKLTKSKNWRKILSFDDAELIFVYKEASYRTIWHAYYAQKFKIAEAGFNYFNIESNHNIGQLDGTTARINKNMIRMTKEQTKTWEDTKDKILDDILLAKFTQVKIARDILLWTHNAELYYKRYSKDIVHRNTRLERLRDVLRKTIIKIKIIIIFF
jgi:predicted NAD-dependent protein-ADP-ribosyltransferase YbiA (DUF1768 family)